jgi:hypothetical protein
MYRSTPRHSRASRRQWLAAHRRPRPRALPDPGRTRPVGARSSRDRSTRQHLGRGGRPTSNHSRVGPSHRHRSVERSATSCVRPHRLAASVRMRSRTGDPVDAGFRRQRADRVRCGGLPGSRRVERV